LVSILADRHRTVDGERHRCRRGSNVTRRSTNRSRRRRAHTKEPKKRVGGRPIVYHVKLSSEERARLEALVRRTTAPQAHVRRAKIALYADEGVGTVEIARRLSLSAQTVSLWRRRFALFGVATLADAPRSGAPRIHGDDTIAKIIELTTTTAPPDGSTHLRGPRFLIQSLPE